MDQPDLTPQPGEPEETQDHADLAAELRAMIASWDGMDAPRKAEIIAGFRSVIDQGGIPIEEVQAWVDSWDSSEELPEPQPRK